MFILDGARHFITKMTSSPLVPPIFYVTKNCAIKNRSFSIKKLDKLVLICIPTLPLVVNFTKILSATFTLKSMKPNFKYKKACITRC